MMKKMMMLSRSLCCPCSSTDSATTDNIFTPIRYSRSTSCHNLPAFHDEYKVRLLELVSFLSLQRGENPKSNPRCHSDLRSVQKAVYLISISESRTQNTWYLSSSFQITDELSNFHLQPRKSLRNRLALPLYCNCVANVACVSKMFSCAAHAMQCCKCLFGVYSWRRYIFSFKLTLLICTCHPESIFAQQQFLQYKPTFLSILLRGTGHPSSSKITSALRSISRSSVKICSKVAKSKKLIGKIPNNIFSLACATEL